jgi:acetyltransferase
MMERTKIFQALKGVRGRPPVDIPALESTMVRFSQLIAEQRWIKELDINPLLASPDRLLALDARVVVYPPEVSESELHPLAIRPYPSQYQSKWIAKDGTPMVMRPMRPEDEPMLVKFHETLSDRTVYLRYLRPMLLEARVAHERLARICHCDYNREINFLAEIDAEEAEERKILGAIRLSKMHGINEARFSVLINDLAQGKGLGKEMLRRLVDIARQEKLTRIEALITPDNEVMKHICGELGFRFVPVSEENLVKTEIDL